MLEHNELEYEVCGDGDPILLIHGSHIAGTFFPLTKEPALVDHYRLIRYHRRGLAGSGPVPASFSIDEQARDAQSILAHLGVDRAHVVGHSYGGAIALQLALDAPALVHSLVLLEPALLVVPSGKDILELNTALTELHAAGDTAAAVDRFLTAVGGPDWRSTTESTVPGGPEQAERDGATFFEVEMPALQKWSFDVGRASRISQPALYVIGSESGALFEEGAELLRSWLPHSEEARLPGVNHSMLTQDPPLVAEAIAGFLRSHAL